MHTVLYICCVSLIAACVSKTGASEPPVETVDPRNILAGHQIPDEGYCDQPYVVVLPNGEWLCTLTTGPGREGDRGQHVVSTTSKDQGRTWSTLVDIEPSQGPEASWVVPLLTPGGRVYAFYNYNGDDVHSLGGRAIRADTIGWYCYRFSDDFGRSWSGERFRLPMRVTACDRGNDWRGDVQIFWGICKPITLEDRACFSFTKLGKYMLDLGEGWVYASTSVLNEPDPHKIRWELLPEGEHGIRAEQFGSVQEEHNIAALADGSLYCVYRTTAGYPCHCYSRDGGRSWSTPEPMTYRPGGRKIKNPRACPRVWRTNAGTYLFWFHNHGGTTYKERNPVWITGGIEREGHIHWAQPEILLYDEQPNIGMSYPDLIEQDGDYWVTETQKSIARVHQLDGKLLAKLWSQRTVKTVSQRKLLLNLDRLALEAGTAPLPFLEVAPAGLAIDAWLQLQDLSAGQTILDNRLGSGEGLRVTICAGNTVRVELFDGTTRVSWDGDADMLQRDTPQHVVINVDAGPKIISMIVNGVLCDGGDNRQYGWGRYTGELKDVSGTGTLRVASDLRGTVTRLRVYGRYLTTSEAVAHFHTGP